MKRELRNVPASVYERLRNCARQRGEDVRFIHPRYVAERLLYRLARSSYRNQFILRGAMLHEVWGGSGYRSTVDLDLLAFGSSAPDDSAAPGDFAVVGEAVRVFLGPPYDALVAGARFQGSWEPGGPWQ